VPLIPAFIPASPAMPVPPLPAGLAAFLEERRPRLLWVGWLEEWKGGDLYGFEETLDLVQGLRGGFPGLGCVFVFSRLGSETDRARVREGVRARGIEDAAHVLPDGLAGLHALFARVELYVRPTRSDGDSVAMRESLAAGTPVVASDAAPRPEGCRLF